MLKIAILGAGMSGFGAAHCFHSAGLPTTLFEKELYHGGLTASFEYPGGYTFDKGPHVSFTENERIQELFAKSVNGGLTVSKGYINNYWQGHWIKHPAQCNLCGLPSDLVIKILLDFIKCEDNGISEIRHYEDWLRANFGHTFAETFPMKYGKKIHTTDAHNMTTDWLGPRMYKPNLEEVLRGALSSSTPALHYITEFRYPLKGGFVSFLDLFVNQTDLRLGSKVIEIDPDARELHFENGPVESYDHLVSSIPLPELVPMISNVPSGIMQAAAKLAYTNVVVVNLGIQRPDVIGAHWTYFYDDDIFFTRLSTPYLQCPNNAPSGISSLQAEIYYSPKYRPLDRSPEDCINPVKSDLRRCGILNRSDKIVFENAILLPYGNVIFDHERLEAMATVKNFLSQIGIHVCGRFGTWDYLWTDQAFLSGEKAARDVIQSIYEKKAT